jgi:outer membrane lipoprotein SlyB
MNTSIKRLGLPAIVVIATVTLVGCSSAPSSSTYTRAQAGTLQEVQMGSVLSVRNIRIEKDSTDVGNAAGAVLGGIAGSTAGEGRGKAAASVAGAVIGGIIGSKIDKSVQTQPGYEITIQLDGGKTVVVTQLADEAFRPGDRVKVIGSNGSARVTH